MPSEGKGHTFESCRARNSSGVRSGHMGYHSDRRQSGPGSTETTPRFRLAARFAKIEEQHGNDRNEKQQAHLQQRSSVPTDPANQGSEDISGERSRQVDAGHEQPRSTPCQVRANRTLNQRVVVDVEEAAL